MNWISKSIVISSVAFLIILSTDGFYLNYTFSEYFSSQSPIYIQSKFLNQIKLCQTQIVIF